MIGGLGGESEGGTDWESGADVHALPRVKQREPAVQPGADPEGWAGERRATGEGECPHAADAHCCAGGAHTTS